MSKSSSSIHIDQRYSTLELTGGREAYFAAQNPDLLVHGGALFKKTVCFKGLTVLQDTTVEGNLTALGNTYLSDLYAGNIFGDIDIIGNLLVNGQPVGTGGMGVQGNCLMNDSGSTTVCANPDDTVTMVTNNTLFVTLGPLGEWQQGTLVSATAPNAHAEGEGVSDIVAALSTYSKTDIDGRIGAVLTTASSVAAHAEGSASIASGVGSHAEGGATQAVGAFSHAEGLGGKATGVASHVEGDPCFAEGDFSHAEGQASHTTTAGIAAHTEGRNTLASAIAAHAEGFSDVQGAIAASGDGAHAEGYATGTGSITAAGLGAHAEGYSALSSLANLASGIGSHAEGTGTSATGTQSHAEGLSSLASGEASHAEGSSTTAAGLGAHAEGLSLTPGGILADGIGSHVEGYTESLTVPSLHAVERGSHVEGYATISATIVSSGFGSHAEGYSDSSILAQGNGAHAEGWNTHATADAAHSEGRASQASGVASHAGGLNSSAINSGQQSHGTVQFANLGDAQANRHVVKAVLPSLSASVDLEDTANGYVISVPNGTSWSATLRLTGVDTTTNDTYCLVQNLRLKNIANVLTVTPMASDTIGEGTLAAGFVAVTYGSSGTDAGLPRFTITVALTPASSNVTRWVACVDSTQVGSL